MALHDADEQLEALGPPQLKLNGRTYTGRLLSIDQFLPFAQPLAAIANHEVEWDEAREIIRRYVDRVFGMGKVWHLPLSFHLLRQPPVVILSAMASFLEAQGRAMNMRVPDLGEMGANPSGSASPDSNGSTPASTTVPNGEASPATA